MWKTVKLGEICNFEGGSQPPKKKFVYEPAEGYVRFIQIRDFKSDKNITYIPIEKKNRLCAEDDILIGRYGASVGKILSGLSGAYNVALMKTIPNEEVVSKGWLHAYLTSTLFLYPLIEVSSRSAQNGFSKDDISDFDVPLPPLEQQKQIVKKLDAAFAEIDEQIVLTECKVESIENLRKTVLVNLFEKVEETAPKKHLKDVCYEFARGKSKHRPRNDERLYGDIIPFVQTGDVSGAEKYLNQFSKKYSDFGIQQSKIWQKGTVCITIAANIGELAILEMDACFPDSVIGAMPDVDVTSSEYLYYLLNFYQKKIKAKSKGSAQQNINLGTFADEQFPFPSLQEQTLLVENLSKIEHHISNIRQISSKKIGQLKILKSAMLVQQMQSEAA
jgi:type I restriction enzyme S subunit